jgi:hypothetical protein
MVDLATIPTTALIDTMFTNVLMQTNRNLWDIREQIYEVRRIDGLYRSSRWWCENLYRVIDHEIGAGYINIPAGVGGAMTTATTCRLPDGLGASYIRYTKGWRGLPPNPRYSVLPHEPGIPHGWTYMYVNGLVDPTVSLQYSEGKIVDQVTHQLYPSGENMTDETYARGLENGPYVTYYDAPTADVVWWTGNCVNGYPEGTWDEYQDDTTHIRTVTFVKGVLQ